jgi:diguanylate cyclase (GGDEF)-like protein
MGRAADSAVMKGHTTDGQSWLCRSGVDRERMLDMDLRLQPVRRAAFAVLALALVACGPWLGYWTLAPLIVAAGLFRFADAKTSTHTHPEYTMFAAWAASEVIIAVSITLTGGLSHETLGWFAIPVVTLSARFSTRGVVIGVATALTLLVSVAFAAGAHAVLQDPPIVIAPAALIITVAMLSTALMRSDIDHRSEAVIDQLTGMLNRHALSSRTVELTQQSEITGDPIGMLVADLDHFKEINDSYGHAVGDAVLTDVAYLIRKHLRAFDLAYRVGGEEFLVLLPGAELNQTTFLAERMRRVIESSPVAGGRNVSVSIGVSASSRGQAFDYQSLFAQADAGLYIAKREGRNRVCAGSPDSTPSTELTVITNPLSLPSSLTTAPSERIA